MSIKAVWVAVSRSSNRQPFFTVSEDEPGSPYSANITHRPLPSDKLCESFQELCAHLRYLGFTPLPEQYFQPTASDNLEWFLRRVPECTE